MALHLIDNKPCPCILWTLSGRDPKDFHDARKKIEAEEKLKSKKGAKHGTSSSSN